jgi:hypothetical protein
MVLAVVAHHVGLVLAVGALGGTAVRAVSPAAPEGLERVVAAVVLATAAAALTSLLLGLVGLGTNALALVLATVLIWLVGRRLLPSPARTVYAELGAWWSRSPVSWRLLLGALVGAWAAWALWLVRYPALGIDSVLYHLPEVVAWIDHGHPGSIEQVYVLPGLPVGNYPLTNEVLMAFVMGISRSFLAASLWAPAAMLLLAAAGWLGLRSLAVPRLPAALAIGALCATPTLTHWQRDGAYTDLPALAWLVATGALCASSRRRPVLIAPALVAAGLAAGTKTTALPLALVALAIALYVSRQHLRALARPLLLGALAGLAVGGYWYLRNLVDHGSPLWPFLTAPWGDPMPASLRPYSQTFLERPGAAISHLGDDYLRLFAGGLVLLAGAALAPLFARARRVWAAAAVTALAFLSWASAPLTGETANAGGVTTLRYLMPVLAAAALALCLAAAQRGPGRALALLALSAALALGVAQSLHLGYPRVPSASTFVLGALAGTVLALVMARLDLHVPGSLPAPAAAAIAIVATGGLLAVGAFGYVGRHARVANIDGLRWLAARDDFRRDHRPVSLVPGSYGPFAGDRLQHRLSVVPASESCGALRRRSRRGWLVVNRVAEGLPGFARLAHCAAGQRPRFDGLYRVYGG